MWSEQQNRRAGPAPVEPGRAGEKWDDFPTLRRENPFPFVCAGCGDCCRGRRDLVLSGYDLWRIARWVRLAPRITAAAFCKRTVGPQSGLPTLVLTPDPSTGNCRFLEGGACAIHPARPLACALYPLGQRSDPVTAAGSYYAQTPLCGAAAEARTLAEYLRDAGVADREGSDARWAVVCTQLSARLKAAAGHPHLKTALYRAERALYYDYTTREEFYPQFRQNTEELWPLLDRILTEPDSIL